MQQMAFVLRSAASSVFIPSVLCGAPCLSDKTEYNFAEATNYPVFPIAVWKLFAYGKCFKWICNKPSVCLRNRE